MTASQTELKHRFSARRKALEARLEELRADASKTQREAIDSVREDLDALGQTVEDAWDDLKDGTVQRLNRWLEDN